MSLIEIISDYNVSGGYMVLETGLIFLLVAFLGWNVKLYLEKPLEGEELEEPPPEEEQP